MHAKFIKEREVSLRTPRVSANFASTYAIQSLVHLRNPPKYDYIISGAGCSGLSLLMHMTHSGKFSGKKILLIDKDNKQQNDRTWCFWETEPGLFEPIVQHHWKEAWFHHPRFSRLLTLEPYHYKLIRGIDFYRYCLAAIRQQPNIEFRVGTITGMKDDGTGAQLLLDGERLEADFIFNSILFSKPVMAAGEYYLLQHFRGQVIETAQPVFEPSRATLMDFRVDQGKGTTFIYVMPFSKTRALVEYTLFSKELLDKQEYESGLRHYIGQVLGIEEYTVTEEETGIIPMTNHRFASHSGNIINIGTAGGMTKPSSGYTFRFIQQHSAAIVDQLEKGMSPVVKTGKKRFHYYDSILLNILFNDTLPGDLIFSRLFSKNKPQHVLRFLDNESSVLEELGIISTLPTWPFLKAGLQQL